MNQHFEERRQQLASLVEKAEKLMELIITYKDKEKRYCQAEDIEDAEINLDKCITCLNSYYNEYIN